MSPGVLRHVTPWRRAKPLRGCTNPAYPSGMASAMPVGTRARPPPAASVAGSRATKSHPASPGRAYAGRGSSGSRRTIGTASTEPSLRSASMLVWMDLEMTGLDPARHCIVEIATLITDDELEIVAEGPDLVVHAPPDALGLMDEVVRNMHTKSGLLPAIEGSTMSLEEAGQATLEFIKAQVPEPRTVPLCGNSIGTDRRFLALHLPDVENYLHYRSIDVSTVKELARRWYPGAYNHAPKKAGGHRALDDIRESVAELRYYRDTVFKKAPGDQEPTSAG